jgi:hypothetical protein
MGEIFKVVHITGVAVRKASDETGALQPTGGWPPVLVGQLAVWVAGLSGVVLN